MSLVLLVPSKWKAISNSIERKFDQTQGKFILERHGIE
jgi:hypothetical protein